METYYTVYKITNKMNGKFYIGTHKTKNLDDKYMGSGKYLLRAQAKYGLENFEKEILFIFDNAEDMYAKEAEIVNDDFISEENTYNLKVGGFGGWSYVNTNIDLGLRARNINLSRPKNLYSRKTIMPLLNMIKEKGRWWNTSGFTDRHHTEETKEKIRQTNRENQSGSKNSQFGTIWINNGSESKKIKKTDVIPEGWIKGRHKK